MIPFKDFVDLIAKSGSITVAAQKLYVSQPALSAALKRLEKEIGLPLFDRSRQPLQLTEAGQAYVRALQESRRIERQLSGYLDDLRGLKAGSFSVGAAHFISSFLLLRIARDFHQAYAGIEMSLSEATSQLLKEQLLQGEIDLVIDYGFDDPVFERYALCREHMLLCVPKESPLNADHTDLAMNRADVLHGRHLTAVPFPLADAKAADFVLMREGNDTAWRSLSLCEAAGFTPKTVFSSDQLVTAFEAAVSGLALTFATDSIVRAVDDRDTLRYYRLAGSAAERTIYIARNAGTYCSAAAKQFILFAQQQVSSAGF